MLKEYVYSPHFDFYIDKKEREHGYSMKYFHVHHKYELYYEITGSRQYFIEDSAYVVNAGDMILIGADQIHKTEHIGDEPNSRIVVNFSDDYLKEITSAFPDIDFVSFFSNPTNHLITCLENKDRFLIEATLHSILDLYNSDDSNKRARCKLLFPVLLLHIKQILENREATSIAYPAPALNPLIADAQKYVAEHYREDLTLQGIADALFISPYHLSRIFKKQVGIGIVDYIKTIRLKVAQNLLVNTSDSITLISDKSGFSSAAHFRRTFKDSIGLSPQKYRQIYHNKINK